MTSYSRWVPTGEDAEHPDATQYVSMELGEVPIAAVDGTSSRTTQYSGAEFYHWVEGARFWEDPAEVSPHVAEDEVLASLRREALFRAEQAEESLAAQEDAERGAVAQRIRHGEEIPERPVHFSWLDGPA